MTDRTWYSMDDQPDGVGGYVWVWYPNPNNPRGGNMRVQSTPIMQEMAVAPTMWAPCPEPDPPQVTRDPWCEACEAGYRLAPGGIHYDDARGGWTWGVCRKVVKRLREPR